LEVDRRRASRKDFFQAAVVFFSPGQVESSHGILACNPQKSRLVETRRAVLPPLFFLPARFFFRLPPDERLALFLQRFFSSLSEVRARCSGACPPFIFLVPFTPVARQGSWFPSPLLTAF